MSEGKIRLLLVTIAPPRNDCGGRIVVHRHLVERNPFELHVASDADFAEDLLVAYAIAAAVSHPSIEKEPIRSAIRRVDH